MTVHSKIGASTCERWWNCPGSVALVEKMPPSLPSPFADEGTAAHEMAERCLRMGLDTVDLVGCVSSPINGKEIEFTEEMGEAVQVYLDCVRFDMETYGFKIKDIRIEHKFHLTSVHPDAFGTNDCNIPVLFDKIIVYDYKHGKGVSVDAEANKQLMYYALGACQEGDFNTVEIVIVQPRAAGEPIRRWALSVSELEKFAQELKGKINETRNPKAPLKCGEWCKKTFCPAMAVCPAVRGQVENDAQIAFSDPKPVSFPKPEEMSPELLQRILDGMELMDSWLKAVFAYAENMANGGQSIPGYKLVRGRQGNRKWKDEIEALNALSKYDGALETIVKSPAQVEKLDKKLLAPIVESLTIRTEGKIILVQESDPREAVSPSAIEAFKQQDSIESLL